MGFPAPVVNYRDFRLDKLNTPEYRHLWWLLFWPVYTLRYFIIESLNPASGYTVIHCALDDKIPFCEGFLIFYFGWYLCMVGMHIFTALYDLDTFKRYSKFLVMAMSISTVIFLLFPSCQELRPKTFPRDNLLTKIVGLLYMMDDNTNVCPSEHVIGAFAVLAAAWNSRYFQAGWKRGGMLILMILVSASTIFLKQHSVLDILAALPVCAVAYYFCFGRKRSVSN